MAVMRLLFSRSSVRGLFRFIARWTATRDPFHSQHHHPKTQLENPWMIRFELPFGINKLNLKRNCCWQKGEKKFNLHENVKRFSGYENIYVTLYVCCTLACFSFGSKFSWSRLKFPVYLTQFGAGNPQIFAVFYYFAFNLSCVNTSETSLPTDNNCYHRAGKCACGCIEGMHIEFKM